VKKIEAIIRPSKLDDLMQALTHEWITGVTVDEVEGYGRQKGHIEIYRGAEYVIEMVPKLRVELIVPEPLVPRVVHELERAVRTGKIGDGKIFVMPVDEVVRVRTGERGEAAL
jgi:nitrogen regulatory protein P-II 1